MMFAILLGLLLTGFGWLYGHFGVVDKIDLTFFIALVSIIAIGPLVDLLGLARCREISVLAGLVCGCWIILVGHVVAADMHADEIMELVREKPATYPAHWAALNSEQLYRAFLQRELQQPVHSLVWGHLRYQAQKGIYVRAIYSSRLHLEREAELWFTWLFQAALILGFAGFAGWISTNISSTEARDSTRSHTAK